MVCKFLFLKRIVNIHKITMRYIRKLQVFVSQQFPPDKHGYIVRCVREKIRWIFLAWTLSFIFNMSEYQGSQKRLRRI